MLFEIQWKALLDKQKMDEPEIPKIMKGTTVMKWSEAFNDHLHRVIGVRRAPLAYVIRDDANVPAAISAQEANAPHSTVYGSIEVALIHRASHNHPLFCVDNETVYYKLEEATRGTQYAAAIKPFQRRKDGKGGHNAIISQFAGRDKWEAELKSKEQLLHTWQWKGQSHYKLESFVTQHRNAFVSMQQCAEHVTYQLPNEYSCVGYLLDAIKCNDPGLQVAMASVHQDQGPGGMRNNFESAVAHLLPACPVAKKRSTKRNAPEISGIDVDEDVNPEIAAFGAKSGKGTKTGVHLRYHKPDEYDKLSGEEKKELSEWRRSSGVTVPKSKRGNGGKGKGGQNSKLSQKAIAAAVDKQVDAKLKKLQDEQQTDDQAEAFIMSCIEKAKTASVTNTQATAGSTAATKPQSSGGVTLQSIIKRTRNGSG